MEEHPQARAIVETLHRAGFIAYYAGGWVRDFLLQRPSDDIDIATNAPPETIQALFPHTVPIGISFGILLVIQDGRPYEVATFRQDFDYHDGRRPQRVAFSNAQEDAKRRDFTINGLFYDPIRKQIFDYVNGRADIEAGIIRAIGNPHERIKEDRLRMMRAIRLACRFNFTIEPKTADAIFAHARELMPAVAIERVVQELEKGLAFGNLPKMLVMLHYYGLLGSVFSDLAQISGEEIERRTASLSEYPQDVPMVIFLLPLFPHYCLEQQLDLVQKLKLSKRDAQFVSFLFHARQLVDAEMQKTRVVENVEWVHLYAHDLCFPVLQIVWAHIPKQRSEVLMQEYEERRRHLHSAIERVRQSQPLVTSQELRNAGIAPGKEMGLLLKEAEKIACNQMLSDADLVIEQLRKSPLWPKNLS